MQEIVRVICNRDSSIVTMISVTPTIGRAPASLMSPLSWYEASDWSSFVNTGLWLADNDSVAPDCNHHITHRGQKWVGGDNTTIDTDAVIAVIMVIWWFSQTVINFLTMEHLKPDVSCMSSSPHTFICLLYSESEGVLVHYVMLFSYQGVLLHCTAPLSQSCLL